METKMTMKVTDDLVVEVIPHPVHKFLMSTRMTSNGYGVTEDNIRLHKSTKPNEFLEGKHWIKDVSNTNGGSQEITFWTLRGIIRLGFFIRSEQAVLFRDWAEDTLYENVTGNIYDRQALLKERLMVQIEIDNLESKLKFNNDYHQLMNNKTKIMRIDKALKEIDRKFVSVQLDLWRQDFVLNSENFN